MVGMNIDKDLMAKMYVEMGEINKRISEEFNPTELRNYLDMEVEMSGN
jgi:hypothetical protein